MQAASEAPVDIHAAVQEAVQEAVNASLIQKVPSPGPLDNDQQGASGRWEQQKPTRSAQPSEEDIASGDENSCSAAGASANILEVPGQPTASLRLHKAQIRVRTRCHNRTCSPGLVTEIIKCWSWTLCISDSLSSVHRQMCRITTSTKIFAAVQCIELICGFFHLCRVSDRVLAPLFALQSRACTSFAASSTFSLTCMLSHSILSVVVRGFLEAGLLPGPNCCSFWSSSAVRDFVLIWKSCDRSQRD